jgi:hypothetical protein
MQETGVNERFNSDDISQILEYKNITSHNFFIQKAQIEIISGGAIENILASIKFIKPDTFLISLRNKAGIEAARIFLTDDTVLINDRINRQLMYGKPGVFGRRYGINTEIIPVFFGDFISEIVKKERISDCIDNKIIIERTLHGTKIVYTIDCSRGKVISAVREKSTNSKNEMLLFDKFIKTNEVVYPSRIKIKYDELEVNINIEKMESPWIGEIVFIPGRNYELIELL